MQQATKKKKGNTVKNVPCPCRPAPGLPPRDDCPYCHGVGWGPANKIPPTESMNKLVPQGMTGRVFTFKRPDNEKCKHPGDYIAREVAGILICPGCDEMCQVPQPVGRGDTIHLVKE